MSNNIYNLGTIDLKGDSFFIITSMSGLFTDKSLLLRFIEYQFPGSVFCSSTTRMWAVFSEI